MVLDSSRDDPSRSARRITRDRIPRTTVAVRATDITLTIMEKNEDILHSREVFDHLDDRVNIEEAEIDGKTKVILHHGYKHLFEIEKFVLTIEKGWLGGFMDEVTFYAKT